MLDILSDLQDLKALIVAERQTLIDKAIPLEVQEAIHDIEAEFEDKINLINEKIKEAENLTRMHATLVSENADGRFLKIRYSPGRIAWNTEKLMKLAEIYPEIATCAKVGEPYTTITKRNQ